jgi:hypothetical protein
MIKNMFCNHLIIDQQFTKENWHSCTKIITMFLDVPHPHFLGFVSLL